MSLVNNQMENSNNDEISLKELLLNLENVFLYLKSKWKLIIIFSLIGAFIGLGIALSDKTTYKAVLTFAMEEDKGGSSLSGAAGLASSFGIDIGGAGGGGAFAASNLTELMKSHLLVEKVLLKPILVEGKNISLAEYYIQLHDLRKKWASNPNLVKIQYLPESNRINYTLQQDSILQEIYKDLIDKDKLSIVQKDKKVSILSIEVISENEIFSKFFCENLALETSQFYIQTKSEKARNNVDVLQKQLDSVRNALNGSISGVAYEIDNVYNLNPAYNIKGTPSKKRQIDVQANTSILTNLVVQLELAKINLRKETPLIQLIDKPMLPLDKQKLSKIKTMLIGGFLSGFICVLFLLLHSFYKKIVS